MLLVRLANERILHGPNEMTISIAGVPNASG